MPKKFTIICDTREQKVLEFEEGVFDEMVHEALPFGDYGCTFRDKSGETMVPIVFERKALGDLYGTMTKGYERFKKEMQRAKDNEFKLVLVIEGSLSKVGKGYKHSRFKGDSMLKKLAMLYVRYDLEYHFFSSREEMSRYIEGIFSAVQRNYKVGEK